MTARHHPDQVTLAAFAYGSLDKARAFVTAAHMHTCPACRRMVSAYEESAGVILEDAPSAAMSMGASETMLSMILHGADETRAAAQTTPPEVELATVLSSVKTGPWRWLGPGVHCRALTRAPVDEPRLFLLKAAPGTSLPEHSHGGAELTLVLQGAYSHQGGRYAVGDVDEADASVEHQPIVDDGDTCICLVAMTGQMRFKGFLGRVLQPFFRV